MSGVNPWHRVRKSNPIAKSVTFAAQVQPAPIISKVNTLALDYVPESIDIFSITSNLGDKYIHVDLKKMDSDLIKCMIDLIKGKLQQILPSDQQPHFIYVTEMDGNVYLYANRDVRHLLCEIDRYEKTIASTSILTKMEFSVSKVTTMTVKLL
jgi:hypothetical protein